MKVSRKAKINDLIKFDVNHGKTNLIIGVDEAGRGPVAGPVVACALYFPSFTRELKKTLKYIDDSKKFSSNPRLRKELANEIKNFADFSIAQSSVEEIEKINILQASLLAMRRACNDLMSQLIVENDMKILVDGKFIIPNFQIKQEPVIKGDSLSASIAAASILAKVERDELMEKLSENYPHYYWEKNKGYPTKLHLDAINEHGTCEWHRKSFLTKVFQKKLPL